MCTNFILILEIYNIRIFLFIISNKKTYLQLGQDKESYYSNDTYSFLRNYCSTRYIYRDEIGNLKGSQEKRRSRLNIVYSNSPRASVDRTLNSCGSKARCARPDRGVSKVWATPPGVENGAPRWQLHRQINQEVNIL